MHSYAAAIQAVVPQGLIEWVGRHLEPAHKIDAGFVATHIHALSKASDHVASYEEPPAVHVER